MIEMKRLKPTNYDVYPVYTCPRCEAEWQQTIEETVFPSGVLCYCGERLSFEPIASVEVVACFVKASTKKTNVPEDKHDDSFDYSEVVSTLIGLGFSKKEAVKCVEENIDDYISSSEELLEVILSTSLRG